MPGHKLARKARKHSQLRASHDARQNQDNGVLGGSFGGMDISASTISESRNTTRYKEFDDDNAHITHGSFQEHHLTNGQDPPEDQQNQQHMVGDDSGMGNRISILETKIATRFAALEARVIEVQEEIVFLKSISSVTNAHTNSSRRASTNTSMLSTAMTAPLLQEAAVIKDDEEGQSVMAENHNVDEELEMKKKTLPEDTFNFMLTTSVYSGPFALAMFVFFLQMFVFALLSANLLTLDDPNNPFNIPTNVTGDVRLTQFLAIFVSVILQNDLLTCFDLLRDGYSHRLRDAFPLASTRKFTVVSICRFLEGGVCLLLMFALIVSSETVIDVLLNFTAVEFVSQLDEAFFYLSHMGYLGKACEDAAHDIIETTYDSPVKHFQRFRKMILMSSFFFLLLCGWIAVIVQQKNGTFLCSTIYVQFGGDELIPSLATFSGLYDKQTDRSGGGLSSQRVEYVERRSGGRAKFAYCTDLKAWTFCWQSDNSDDGGVVDDNYDPCEWKARSSVTGTFDLTQSISETWYIQGPFSREVVLDHLYLSCYDCSRKPTGDCNDRGFCEQGVCSCNEGWFGSRCEFIEPCPMLATDIRFGTFLSVREWSSDFKLLYHEDALVTVYNRPVYISDRQSGSFDVIFFTGRRWAAAYDNQLNFHTRNNYTEKDIAEYFQNPGFHALWSGFKVEFLSEPTDIETAIDANSPVGLQWTFANAKEGKEFQAATTRTIDTTLLCSFCTERNPCRYDGVCNRGNCECSLGSSGALCEGLPVGNGHCDAFFNTIEFGLDGGDCCDSTCVSSEHFICGTQGEGYVSSGFPFCQLPADEWFLNGDPIVGDQESMSGYHVALSSSGNVLAVAGYRPQQPVSIYDKDGTKWKLRSVFNPSSGASLGFIQKFKISEEKYHLSNPLFASPVQIAITSEISTSGDRFDQLFRCERSCQEIILSRSSIVSLGSAFDMNSDGLLVHANHHAAGVDELVVSNRTSNTSTHMDGNMTQHERFLSDNVRMDQNAVDLSFGFNTSSTISIDVNGNMTLNDLFLSDDGYIFSIIFGDKRTDGGEARFYSLAVDKPTTENERSGSPRMPTRAVPLGGPILIGDQKGSLVMARNGVVFAVGTCDSEGNQTVVVHDWNGTNWLPRISPLLDDILCSSVSVAMSSDGQTLAFASTGIKDAGSTLLFAWRGYGWERVGESFRGGEKIENLPRATSVTLSGSGNAVAVGIAGIDTAKQTGVTYVYSRPRTNECLNGTSLLRLSFTGDEKNTSRSWYLVHNETNEIIDSGGFASNYRTTAKDVCVEDPAMACLQLIVSQNDGAGISRPGGYGVILDGLRVSTPPFDLGYLKQAFIGKCSTVEKCSSAQDLLQILAIVTDVEGLENPQNISWSLMDKESVIDSALGFDLSEHNKSSEIAVLQQACLDTANECSIISIHSGFTRRNGFIADGLVKLYLNEVMKLNPGVDLRQKFYFGDNECCPIGMNRVQLAIQVCSEAAWTVNSLNGTVLAGGKTDTIPIEPRSCNLLENPLEVFQEDLCVVENNCYNLVFESGIGKAYAKLFSSRQWDTMYYPSGIYFGSCVEKISLPDPIELHNNVTLSGQASHGGLQAYRLEINAEDSASCTLEGGGHGDANLFLRYGLLPSAVDLEVNDCSSTKAGSVESCATLPAMENTVLFVVVEAKIPYTDLAIRCETTSPPPPPDNSFCDQAQDVNVGDIVFIESVTSRIDSRRTLWSNIFSTKQVDDGPVINAIVSCEYGDFYEAPGKWFHLTGIGPVTATTCSDRTMIQTRVEVFTDSCPDPNVCPPDYHMVGGYGSSCTTVSWTAVRDAQYLIFVASAYDSDQDSVELSIFNNDQCSYGFPIAGSSPGSSIDSTADQVPACGRASASGDTGVWYTVEGKGDLMSASTCEGTAIDTQISVFTGSCDALVCLTGDDNACGLQSWVSWLSELGVIYYILIHGEPGTFSLKIQGDLLPNDLCAGAQMLDDVGPDNEVTSVPVPLANSNIDNGLPYECLITLSGQATRGIWYAVQGNGGWLRIELEGENSLETWIGVYSGDCDDLKCTDWDFAIPSPTEVGVVYLIYIYFESRDAPDEWDVTLNVWFDCSEFPCDEQPPEIEISRTDSPESNPDISQTDLPEATLEPTFEVSQTNSTQLETPEPTSSP